MTIPGQFLATINSPTVKLMPTNATSATIDDPLHQYVSVLLLRAFHRVLDHLADAREEIGVTVNEARLLTVAQAYPKKTLESLLPHTYLAASAMEDALTTLQQRGYLSVNYEGRVFVTDLGLERVHAYYSKFKELEAYLFRDLRADQIDSFRATLMSIMASTPLRKGLQGGVRDAQCIPE